MPPHATTGWPAPACVPRARRVVLAQLQAAGAMFDAIALHRQAGLHDARISLPTVYRTLREFERSGIVRATAVPHGRMQWQLASAAPHAQAVTVTIERLARQAARLGYRLVPSRHDPPAARLCGAAPIRNPHEPSSNPFPRRHAARQPPRAPRAALPHAAVLRSETVSPHMRRIVLGGRRWPALPARRRTTTSSCSSPMPTASSCCRC
jgi:hypothetical protein